MTEDEKQELAHHNSLQLVELDRSAAARVAGLLAELRKPERNTFLKLRSPVPKGRRVEYEVVEGNRTSVEDGAKALGFKQWADGILEI